MTKADRTTAGPRSDSGVLRELGALCRELRKERGLAYPKVGYWLDEGGSEAALRKWESNKTQPLVIDEVVKAYAKALEVTAASIWKEAVKRFEEKEKRR